MKAFLLAGGLGTRLLPLTEKLPKCLLPIRGTPMLQLWFDLCRRYGVNEIVINVHRHGDLVTRCIDEHGGGLNVRVFEETTLLGSAGTVQANRDWVAREKAFWIFYADVLTTTRLDQMLEFHNMHQQAATVGVCEVSNPSHCGIVQVDNEGIVRNFVEKPKIPIGNLGFSGIMVATTALLERIPQKHPADFGFDVLPSLVNKLAAYRISDFLIDIGTPETYRKAQDTWPAAFVSCPVG